MPFSLFSCCFFNKKSLKKVDTEISTIIQPISFVTGQPIESNLHKSKILVRINEFGHLKTLANEGWKTNGEILIQDNISYLWYEKDDQKIKQPKDIPSHPDKDTKAEFDWERIVDNELEVYQTKGWLARDLCPQTNRIWVCFEKSQTC